MAVLPNCIWHAYLDYFHAFMGKQRIWWQMVRNPLDRFGSRGPGFESLLVDKLVAIIRYATLARGSSVKLYRTTRGIFVEEKENFYAVSTIEWDELIASVDLHAYLHAAIKGEPVRQFDSTTILAPVVNQEV